MLSIRDNSPSLLVVEILSILAKDRKRKRYILKEQIITYEKIPEQKDKSLEGKNKIIELLQKKNSK